MLRGARRFVAGWLLLIPALAMAQEAAAPAKPAARPSIYDTKADADKQVAQATARAGREGKRVLLMFGGDWCGWCHKLHGLFESDKAIRAALAENYVLTLVDTKAPGAEALLDRCKGDLTGVGYPFLAVLDPAGKVVARQKTDPLEVGDHHDPAKVKGFLDEWAPPRATATAVMDAALARAASEDKLVFLHFGTPSCGWCRRLEGFLGRADVAPIFGRDFVDANLDLVRTPGADEVLGRYNPGRSGGDPWFAVLDAKGEAVATSDGPGGNIGYPYTPEEVDRFVALLATVRRRIEPAQVEAIGRALRDEAKRDK